MPRDLSDKAATAFRTIGEVSRDTGLPQHILRYWETRFAALRPVQRAGNRRYYRPADIALVRRIDQLLNRDGYTVRGVQQLLARECASPARGPTADPLVPSRDPDTAVRAVRDMLARALADDAMVAD